MSAIQSRKCYNKVRLAQGLTVMALSCLAATSVLASSHREAPLISTMGRLDGADFYMFNSYEPGRAGFVTMVADYNPLQDPAGGPNFYTLDPDGVYKIHIDNVGDARSHLTFEFRFQNKLQNQTLNVGGTQVPIPLINSGKISQGDTSKINVVETFTLGVSRSDGDHDGDDHNVTPIMSPTGGTTFSKPIDYIGTKTLGEPEDYEEYAAQHIYTIKIPGCAVPGRVFVGQRKDPFKIAVGKAFDLLNLNPLGGINVNKDDLAQKNVTALALEVSASCLTAGGDPVIGAWTTSSTREGRRLLRNPPPGENAATVNKGQFVQVSRLSMPLVNELVIGLKDKDRFNNSQPANDGQFLTYITNPTFPTLIETLFPSAKAPTKFPRQDLVTAYLTGIPGLNQLKQVTPSEMQRLNTSIPAVPKGSQNNLGVLGGDNAGFPNGRRPGDDVVDLTLRVSMGALCTLNNPAAFGCTAADAPAGKLPLTDGVTTNDSFYGNTFPYLTTPLPGGVKGPDKL